LGRHAPIENEELGISILEKVSYPMRAVLVQSNLQIVLEAAGYALGKTTSRRYLLLAVTYVPRHQLVLYL
jgi:hypothetical protein